MNKFELTGFLTKDPVLRTTESGKIVGTLSLAVRRTQENTDFLYITCWGVVAEFARRNFHKGSRIEVLGHIRQNTWTEEDGTKRSATELVAEQVDFGERAPKSQQADAPVPEDIDEELPL